MKTTLKINCMLLAVASLVACGGSDSSTSPIDKYVGVWQSAACEPWNDVAYAKVSFKYTKLTSQSMLGELSAKVYSNSTCTGNSSTETLSATYEFQGTKTLASGVGDKFLVKNSDQTTDTELLYVKNNLLYASDPSASVGADGYSDALVELPFTRNAN